MDIHSLQGKSTVRKKKGGKDGLSNENSADPQTEGKSVVREFPQRTGRSHELYERGDSRMGGRFPNGTAHDSHRETTINSGPQKKEFRVQSD